MSRNEEAAFIAGVTASTTHEIRNILAIVQESAGLIEDLVRSCERSKSLDQNKLLRALGRIDAQVNRGAEVLSHLNRLAHSVDHEKQETDLAELVRRVVFLGQLLAKRTRHTLQARGIEHHCSVVTAPLYLQMALFSALRCCLEQLPEGTTVTISLTSEGDRHTIEFSAADRRSSPPPDLTRAGEWPALLRILERFPASVEISQGGYGFRLLLPAERTG